MTRARLTGSGPASTKTLSVGIGCRLHTPAADIEAAVRATLGPYAFEQIGTIATIDIKAKEAGLLAFCARHALRLQLFTREQIAAIPMDSSSAAAHAHLGVDGVCEPCALLAAQALERATASRLSPIATIATIAPIARLVVRKTVHAGVTVAIASTGDDANSNTVSLPTAPNDQDLR
ncbi:cobalamin biosynthesis protein [Paraburkholderia sp.]|uniref:cobalamin biosynthesis protein n=1 Tax=Paraburkholderia sp. TaxID=1926495 RepID=UPI002F4262BE